MFIYRAFRFLALTALTASSASYAFTGLALAETGRETGSGNTAFTLRSVASGFAKPAQLTFSTEAADSLAVVEQSGRVVAVDESSGKPGRIILDLSETAFFDEVESGLLGAAFHPKYSENGKLYAYYTKKSKIGLENILAEFSNTNPTKMLTTDDQRNLFRLPLQSPHHLGGNLVFGPDGFLYVSVGDNSSNNDPEDRGQNQRDLYGSILRIDINDGKPYLAPVDNPYVVSGLGNRDVFAVGLRNPRSFAFDPLTKNLFVGDAGQGLYQEINLLRGGVNYGWSVFDGPDCLRMRFECLNEKLTAPYYFYGKEAGTAIVLGAVSQSRLLPELNGQLLFADRSTGTLWLLPTGKQGPRKAQKLLETKREISAIAADSIGEIYLADFKSGEILRLESTRAELLPPDDAPTGAPKAAETPLAAPTEIVPAKPPLVPKKINP